MKDRYIDLMETVVSTYDVSRLRQYTDEVIQRGISEHGFPRITANIGILIAHGRKTELTEIFLEMMDLCCREIPLGLEKNGGGAGNDFSVKEIVCCILEIEKAQIVPAGVTNQWRKELANIEPKKTYTKIAPVPVAPVNNWAAFGACSEQLRKYAGIGDESEFIDNQIASQIFSFDEQGMYRDPNEPMVYDMVTRLQLAVALHFGYDGKSKAELEELLMKSADATLAMQSVTGEIPYGGRSNQFLHNEAFFAALCEFYAGEFKKRGDSKKAGQFKRAARIATESILPWLEDEKKPHVKNHYATDSHYGCEVYAYYMKYMVTVASWLYLAYAMADDSIPETECPAEKGGMVFCTSKYFHKVFCSCGGYFAEFDTAADPHYDASGLGRIHKNGVPSALCLSTPCPEYPNYTVDVETPTPLSICGGIKVGGKYWYSCGSGVNHQLTDKTVSENAVEVRFVCSLDNGGMVTETCRLSESGVIFTVEGDGELEILFPVFAFDGATETEIAQNDHQVMVRYQGFSCRFTTENTITDKQEVCANRNGHYRKMAVSGRDKISLAIEM